MMRAFLFSSVLAVHLAVALYADDVPNPLNPSTRDILFRELMAGLPQKGERANTARLELTYWHERESLSLQKVPDRQFITTKNGDKVEIVFVHSSAMSMPGTDFTMALLLNERRVVDWASCWTYNRDARQKPLFEDVDGDGFVDVAFEYGDGFSGRQETRKHIIPGSNRKWLYAYAIEADSFKSIFPNTEHAVKIGLRTETGSHPVTLVVKGIPEVLREYQLVECEVSLTNTSPKDLVIKPCEWLDIGIEHAGFTVCHLQSDKRTVVRPSETVSQKVLLGVDEVQNEAMITFRFVANSGK